MKVQTLKVRLAVAILSIGVGCSKNTSEPTGATSSQMQGDQGISASAIETSSNPIAKQNQPVVPEHLKMILAALAEKPEPQVLLALKPEDASSLISRYKQETALTNKLSLTIALAFVGDEETVSAFKSTLLDASLNRQIDLQEEAVILFTVEALGFLAHRHDSAFQFLADATDPWFWKQNTKWRSEKGEHEYETLAGRAINALGFSDRSDVDGVFERIKQQPFVSDGQGGGWSLHSALLGGVFFRDLLRERGLGGIKAIYGTEEIIGEYRKWTRTENGKEWRAWRQQWEKDHPKEAGLLPP